VGPQFLIAMPKISSMAGNSQFSDSQCFDEKNTEHVDLPPFDLICMPGVLSYNSNRKMEKEGSDIRYLVKPIICAVNEESNDCLMESKYEAKTENKPVCNYSGEAYDNFLMDQLQGVDLSLNPLITYNYNMTDASNEPDRNMIPPSVGFTKDSAATGSVGDHADQFVKDICAQDGDHVNLFNEVCAQDGDHAKLFEDVCAQDLLNDYCTQDEDLSQLFGMLSSDETPFRSESENPTKQLSEEPGSSYVRCDERKVESSWRNACSCCSIC